MKAALTISRKRYLVQMKISSREHSEKYTFPSLPPVWKTLEVVSVWYAFQIILSVQGQSSQKASGKRVWTTSIHLLGKLDKVYNRASIVVLTMPVYGIGVLP